MLSADSGGMGALYARPLLLFSVGPYYKSEVEPALLLSFPLAWLGDAVGEEEF